jgi:DNA-binding transcriptional regulator YhcF (GntR family)
MDLEPGKTKTAQVAARLRHRIASGEWDIGQALPGLTDLEKEYGVSFGTVRTAQQFLVDEGLLSKPEQGVSTHVIARPSASDSRDAVTRARAAYRALGDELERVAAATERDPSESGLDLRRLDNHKVHAFARHTAAAAALANGYKDVHLDGPQTRLRIDDQTAQVIARRMPGAPWQFMINRIVVEDAVAVILVDLTGNHPDFYVAPAQWVRDEVQRRYDEWLASKGGRRPRNPASDHATLPLDESVQQWHRRWNVLADAG